MPKITSTEKGYFLKLFNCGGNVLNFCINDFNNFTMESIGIPLCQKYLLSKGKSLSSFLYEADEEKCIKLIIDLFDYYELNCYQYDETKYKELFPNAKKIVERLRQGNRFLSQNAISLKESFSSDYISTQIDLMFNMAKENPTEAIGKARELIESCCKTILESEHIDIKKDWDIVKLTNETFGTLHLMPEDIPENIPAEKEMKILLRNLRNISTNIASLRNFYGSGHGKSASYKGLNSRHANLAVGASITLVQFLWDTYQEQRNKIRGGVVNNLNEGEE